MDSRRIAHLRRAAAAQHAGSRARVHQLVRWISISRRQSSVLRRQPRSGPGSGKRQPRRTDLPYRRVLPPHAGSGARLTRVAARGHRRQLHRQVASHPNFLGVLRITAGVDQSRRLLCETGALVLGRFLRREGARRRDISRARARVHTRGKNIHENS